jgi:dihydroxyacid dehydratase/phosphogluconate dehydratase
MKWRAGGMAQVVEHLSSKHKALNSNPSTARIKQIQNEMEHWHIFSSENGRHRRYNFQTQDLQSNGEKLRLHSK